MEGASVTSKLTDPLGVTGVPEDPPPPQALNMSETHNAVTTRSIVFGNGVFMTSSLNLIALCFCYLSTQPVRIG
jgi:hypothetical protein